MIEDILKTIKKSIVLCDTGFSVLKREGLLIDKLQYLS